MRNHVLNGPHRDTRKAVLSPVFNPFVPRTIGSTYGTAVGIAAETQAPGSGAFVQGFVDGVINLLGGGPSRWDDAGPGVHTFFHYGPQGTQALQDYLDANYPEAFGSLDAVLAFAPYVLKSNWNAIIHPGDTWHEGMTPGTGGFYKQGVTEAGYQGMGIDYPASLALYVPGQPNRWVPMIHPAQAGGRGGAGTQADDGAPPTPQVRGSNTGLLLAGAAALYFLNK